MIEVYPGEKILEWMDMALDQARLAESEGEVPVGALLIHNGEVLAVDHNRTIGSCDPTAHAEMLVMRRGAERIGNYRLVDTLMVCSLEPCLMCYSAMVHARIGTLAYAADDFKAGVFSTGAFDRVSGVYNHCIRVEKGVRASESSVLLSGFFRKRRKSFREEA